ncbi:MAG: hypothetical protein JO340_21410 [Acidobacteriaceae bacterium]|nr:hypothetical protein [Acidobacteriaceae bacterium]
MPPALALLVESGGQVETAVIIRRLEEWMEQNGYRRQQPNRALGCLRKAGLAENPRKGYWIATSEGIQRHTLSEGDARKLFDEHNCTGRRRRPER